ncbi:UspA domain protein [Methylobacterium sp. 4-46]|nr:universal stress protein [Methylobacterium nodulans]ACA17302.1 UspA domain protein [Methylobacterium sp. 4-46]WFT83575.1 universal stress protein [Methylobacterium nodulans]
MTYANVLVSLDPGEAASDRVKLAANLARKFRSRLTGIAAREVPYPLLVTDVHDAEIRFEANAQLVRAELGSMRARFERHAGSGLRLAWHQAAWDPQTYMVRYARSADLLVVSRRGENDPDPGALGVAPGPLVLQVGRPVLVAPPGVTSAPGSRIVVAWKDTVEARRAVSAALGFIGQADQVLVVSVRDGGFDEGTEEVAAHLGSHGARATAHLLSRTGERVADAILDFARENEADLIVSGAYGHARLAEWIFGGVTRNLLLSAPVCCLLSH